MSDLRISELPQLIGANLAGGDFFALADVSASETKKITVTDAIGYGVTLIADATIPGAKILFSAGTIPGSSLSNGAVDTAQLADDGVTAAKLANESTVDLVTSLPVSGAYTGQLALDTDDLKVYCWDGSTWQSIKAAGSINTVNGDTSGTINIGITTSGDTVTIAATLDNTANANEFLAGPTNAGGAVGYRVIDPTDLPTATTTAKGAVQVNGEGLRMDGNVIEINNDVAASPTDAKVVTYDAKGLVTGGRAIINTDLPIATLGGNGAVQPGTGLSVTGAGVLNHSNVVTGATASKVTFDAQGHITGSELLAEADIPDLPASKITTGTFNAALFATNSLTGAKLADSSVVQFGGSGSTAGIVTFPTAEYKGQYFYDELNGDLYLWNGNSWTPITITAGELIYAGTYDASTNTVESVTAAGAAAGLVVSAALPAASADNLRYYVVISQSGTGTSPAPAVLLAPPDMLVSGGTSWELIDVSSGIGSQIASNVSFTPYGGIGATNVQTALQELDDDKLRKDGGTITGVLEIGSTGSIVFEGSTADANETTIAITDPTADRTVTIPNQSGNFLISGNASIVNADISASAEIAVSKLADGSARQLLQTDAAGTGVEWTDNVDIPGTLDVTGTATFDGTVSINEGTY